MTSVSLPVDDPDVLASVLATWVTDRLADGGRRPAGEPSATLLGTPATGNSNVTLPFVVSWSDGGEPLRLVLRMQRPTNQIFLEPDVAREHRVLTGLAAAGTVAAPVPRWLEPDPSVAGHPFFVMDMVAGTVPTGSPSIHATGWLAERTPAERERAWASTIENIAALHRVDWRTHTPFLTEGVYGTTLSTRLDHLDEWYRWVTRDREFPITDAALTYLRAHVPAETGGPVLLWGDARLGNTMFGDDASVTALLDWELASIGPAGVDLGWFCTFDQWTTDAHGVPRLEGYPDREATIERYTELTGTAIDDIRWYEIHCAWVLTVTIIRMLDINIDAGRLSPDSRMGHGNLTAQMLARWLDLPVPDLDPDYAARRGLPVSGSR